MTEDGRGYLLGGDLPALDSGVYELWGQDPSGALVALVSMEQPGIARFTAGDDVAKLLMTVEPDVADQPTTQPIMQGVVI
jgi:hypothetical protein